MSPPGKFATGLVVGILLTAAGSFGLNRSSSAPSSTTEAPVAEQTVVEIKPWFEDEEIRFGPTVMLPRGLRTDDGTVVFEYEIGGLGPSLQGRDDIEPQGDVVAAPERWLLTTVSGAQVEAMTSLRSEAVRFELAGPDEEIDTISVVDWRVASLFGDTVELPMERSASTTFRGGTVTIETVLEQTVSTIVQLDVDSSGDDWQSPLLLPADSRWRWSGRQFGGVQLIWQGEDAPKTLSLEDVAFEWRPVSGEVVVYDRASQP